jgi:hypothetical protein
MSNRIFYAVQSASFLGIGNGLQSISVNASVDFEQAFQLGTLQICANLEGVPNVEISTERAWQGAATSFWNTAGGDTASVSSFTGSVQMKVADDTSENFATVSPFVNATGMSISSWGVTFQVDGFATETCTVVGNDINWGTGTAANPDSPNTACTGATFFRRQDVALESRAQSVAFSCDVGREDLFQLGSKSPYARPATFPVECSSDWEYLATTGSGGDTYNSALNTNATTFETLTYEGVSMGGRLAGSNYSGGDAGGGNATIVYNYIGYNALTT